MYLFHKIENLIDGRRLIIFMDESWKLLQDEYFEDLVENKLKTIRKQNGFLVHVSPFLGFRIVNRAMISFFIFKLESSGISNM